MVGFGDPGRGNPDAPAFSDGWYGYVRKDLMTVLGRRVRGRSGSHAVGHAPHHHQRRGSCVS